MCPRRQVVNINLLRILIANVLVLGLDLVASVAETQVLVGLVEFAAIGIASQHVTVSSGTVFTVDLFVTDGSQPLCTFRKPTVLATV